MAPARSARVATFRRSTSGASSRSDRRGRPVQLADGAIVEELQRAGFVTIGTDAEGEETWTLTPTGEQIALQLDDTPTQTQQLVAEPV